MRLWSIVVIQPQKPSVFRGRRNGETTDSGAGGGGARAGGSRTVATNSLPGLRWRSLERFQVGDELGDVFLGQVEVRHHRARLGSRRVAQPGPEVVRRHGEDGARENRPALEVGQVGP